MNLRPRVVTFDVFSALIDSRSGWTSAFTELALAPGCGVDAAQLYRRWDDANKSLQRASGDAYVPYVQLSAQALRQAYAEVGLHGDPAADNGRLLETMARWPLYDDVRDALTAIGARHEIALLSNIDDHLLATTQAAALCPVAVTSQQAGCYKPHPGIYRYAEQQLGQPLLHVPASARDVRGALEAGIAVVRVRRPGHTVDPAAPAASQEIDDLGQLAELLGHDVMEEG